MQDTTVTLGRISGVFGVRGWVKIHSFTEPRENVVTYRDWLLCHEGRERPTRVLEGQRHGKTVIARLEDIDDRDAAQALVEWEIRVPRSALPPPEPGEYYWADLEGLRVCTAEGVDLGLVVRMLETPAHDVMVIQGERERLVPFVQGRYVLAVDLAAGTITVDWDPEF
jgi:16S rRNA processing protein RimM